MEIKDFNIEEYLNKLSSGEPTPGGGAVAALNAAQGTALISMVVNHTVGKKKYAEFESFLKNSLGKCDDFLRELINKIDEDRKAFGKVAEAYSMKKDTEEEKALRKARIAKASEWAAEVPFDVMKISMEAMKINFSMIDKTNKNLASDLYVSALNLDSAIKSANKNVVVNLPYIENKELKSRLEEGAEDILRESKELLNEILKKLSN